VSSQAVALPVQDLYTGQVLVTSRGKTELANGARAGLLQVLVRVSGSTDVENNAMIAAALGNPEAYYYQYGYESTDKVLTVGDKQVPARMLRISFEPGLIAKLLRRAGFPVWGSNRPGILLWIATSDEDGRRIITDSDKSGLLDALDQQAKLRGLPLLYPILDLEDTSILSTAEVWGLFLDRIDSASVRYHPDVILAGRVQQDRSGQWTGRWYYRVERGWQGVDNTGFTVENLVDTVVNRLADELAVRYAVDSSKGSILLRVEAINDVEDYAAASAYLQSLAPVVDSSVIEVEGNEVLFRLSTEGQSEQLLEIIGLDENMVLINAGTGMTKDSPLHYRWIRH